MRDLSNLFVVVSTNKFGGGSRVCCVAMEKDKAEETLKQLEVHPNTKHLGPFRVVSALEAEHKKLYGD